MHKKNPTWILLHKPSFFTGGNPIFPIFLENEEQKKNNAHMPDIFWCFSNEMQKKSQA